MQENKRISSKETRKAPTAVIPPPNNPEPSHSMSI
jgi:hypothetical protein